MEPDERTIRVLRGVIRDAPDGVVSLGEFHSAKELFEAVESYDPVAGWQRDVCNRISSPRNLGNLLASQRDHRSLTIREHGNTNHYRIQESSRGVQPLDVETIEDLFEFPCMANMAERLHEKKPVRKDLYNFARVVMWLPQYQDSDLDSLVADLKDVFSRWSWYDEQVTDYQIRYEFSNTIGGDTPLPMNCDNDDMQRYCIGQEQCPHSIWGSLPFPDEMYDQGDEAESTGGDC